MKTAKIIRKDLGGISDTVFLIEDEGDLKTYEKFTNGVAGDLIKKAIASDLPPYKLDHLIPGKRNPSFGLMRAAMNAAQVNGIREEFSIWNNPLWQIMPAAAIKIATLSRLLADGPVCVNKAGGFMPYRPEDVTILDVFDSKPHFAAPADVINKHTRYVVLENDWELPKESSEYLKRVDPRYSTIFDLRGHPDGILKLRLREFKKTGGQIVFVYTTGMDVPQMYRYTDAIISAGLSELVFYFTGGKVSEAVREYLAKYKPKMSITVLDSLEPKARG